MPFPLLIALFLAFGFDPTGLPGSPPKPGPLARVETLQGLGRTLGGVAFVGLFAVTIGRVVAFRIARDGRVSGRSRKLYRLGVTGVDLLSLLGFGWAIHGLEWPRVVRSGLGMGDPVLLDDALILLPFLLAQLAGWWGLFAAERAIRTVRGLDFGGVGRHLVLKARQSFGMVLPVALVYGVGSGLIHRAWPGAVDSPWDQPVSLAVMGLLVLTLAPALVRLAWPTRPLPPGPLRDRLERVGRRVGFRCTDILVWDTNGALVNAGVTGSLPWFRYVFLSDALIENLSPYEVAAVYGHEVGHIAHRHLVYFGFFILGSLGVLALAGGAINEGLRALPMPPALAPGTTGAIVAEAALTLAAVGGYFFAAFGFLSRRFEGQADLFGCRVVSCGLPDCPPHADPDADAVPPWGPSHGLMPSVCPIGVRIFIGALESVAVRNGMRSAAWSWRHGSILRRIAFLESLIETPGAEPRFQAGVKRLRWLMGAALAACAALAAALASG